MQKIRLHLCSLSVYFIFSPAAAFQQGKIPPTPFPGGPPPGESIFQRCSHLIIELTMTWTLAQYSYIHTLRRHTVTIFIHLKVH